MNVRRTHVYGWAKCALLAGAILGVVWSSAAQFGRPSMTPDFHGVWHPVVGSGATYQITDKNTTTEMEISIVGKEEVSGKTGYWMEMGFHTPQMGQMYAKSLMVIGDNNYKVARMVIQMPGRDPMEMPTGMMGSEGMALHETDVRDSAEHAGTEDVTTPAGTFSCEHYRDKDGKWGDVWLSEKVTPWALVKSVSDGRTMTIQKVLTDEKDRITGTPEKFDPSNMMPGGGSH